jgi:integrative and conjugative element protein (TIGR02256 family)
MRLVFQVDSARRLVFTSDATLKMKSFAQQGPRQKEAGGVLLGRHLLESNDLAVDEVTTPQVRDIRSRFGFFRSKQHNELALSRWKTEGGTLAYMGLWHTHPEADPVPSQVDLNDWERAVTEDVYEGSQLFFPIVGTEHVRVWAKARGGPLRSLNLVEVLND